MTQPMFEGFDKIPRWKRELCVTEKIDGTNAQVFIRDLPDDEAMPTDTPIVAVVGKLLLYAGSRNRWITPEHDNFGFAAFVKAANRSEFLRQRLNILLKIRESLCQMQISAQADSFNRGTQ